MNQTQNIRNVVYGVLVVLVLILLGVVSYSFYSGQTVEPLVQVQNVKVGGVDAVTVSSPFEMDVLNSAAFKNLNRSLFDANKVPVKVPETRGKANLFGS